MADPQNQSKTTIRVETDAEAAKNALRGLADQMRQTDEQQKKSAASQEKANEASAEAVKLTEQQTEALKEAAEAAKQAKRETEDLNKAQAADTGGDGLGDILGSPRAGVRAKDGAVKLTSMTVALRGILGLVGKLVFLWGAVAGAAAGAYQWIKKIGSASADQSKADLAATMAANDRVAALIAEQEARQNSLNLENQIADAFARQLAHISTTSGILQRLADQREGAINREIQLLRARAALELAETDLQDFDSDESRTSARAGIDAKLAREELEAQKKIIASQQLERQQVADKAKSDLNLLDKKIEENRADFDHQIAFLEGNEAELQKSLARLGDSQDPDAVSRRNQLNEELGGITKGRKRITSDLNQTQASLRSQRDRAGTSLTDFQLNEEERRRNEAASIEAAQLDLQTRQAQQEVARRKAAAKDKADRMKADEAAAAATVVGSDQAADILSGLARDRAGGLATDIRGFDPGSRLGTQGNIADQLLQTVDRGLADPTAQSLAGLTQALQQLASSNGFTRVQSQLTELDAIVRTLQSQLENQ